MIHAPKIIGETWFNSKPLTSDLKGWVVLYDFWTYTCVNCVRTLPHLRGWWEKYKDKGLVIIGIHTPEFEFEKDPQNVGRAVKDLDVTWPVVLDSDYVNWNNFANRFWPAKYLADQESQIVYSHFGEGAYAETEQKIRTLLHLETSFPSEGVEHEHGAVCFIPTPEIYCGSRRGNPAFKNTVTADGEIGLTGKWLIEDEYVESQEEGAELLLRFHATEVNLVLHPVGRSAVAEVSFEGSSKEITIDEPRMYNLLRSKDLMDGVLSIKAKKDNFRAYAFTFSGCEH